MDQFPLDQNTLVAFGELTLDLSDATLLRLPNLLIHAALLMRLNATTARTESCVPSLAFEGPPAVLALPSREQAALRNVLGHITLSIRFLPSAQVMSRIAHFRGESAIGSVGDHIALSAAIGHRHPGLAQIPDAQLHASSS